MKPKEIARLLGVDVEIIKWVLNPPSLDGLTHKQAKQDFLKTDRIGNAGIIAMLKWLNLCTTPKQAEEAFDNAIAGSDPERFATARWDELSLAEVRKARTPKQLQKAFREAQHGSYARNRAAQKLAEMPEPK